MTATFSTLYASVKSTATTATAQDANNPHKHDVAIDRTNVVAGDKLAFTIVDLLVTRLMFFSTLMLQQ